MQLDSVRVTRLREWLNQFEGSVARLCRHYGLESGRRSFLAQVLSGHRALGERAARKLEADCGMPAGWLDQQPAPTTLPFECDMARVRALDADDRKLIEDFIALVLNRAAQRAAPATKTKARLNLDEATQPRPRTKHRAA